ncbi:MAG: hypothetical protein EOO86_16085 [Pedobacter sp.]|nr:MAG: hypothetical protein EOO86_16085 [Pedobacter sp.]
MKTIFRTGILLSFCLIALTSMTLKPKRIIFFGDSITQQGVSKNGYVTLIKKSLDSTKYEVLGAGIGGNKIYDLYLRLEDDVLNKKPDLVVIYVGINDVWHKQSSHTGTDYDKYLNKEKGILTTDRVHLNETGNKLVAEQLLPLVK